MKTCLQKGYLVFPVSEGKFCVWEFEMERVDGTPIYWLGNTLGQLFCVLMRGSVTYGDVMNSARNARGNLDFFINQAQGLSLSKNAASQIVAHIDKALSKPLSDIIATEDGSAFSFSIINFQSVLNAELPQLNIFFISQHRDRDMNILINNGERALSQNTINKLGDTSKDEVIREIREAARCLAFNIATAVGLHLCRAVESIVVKEYFPSLNLTVPKNRNLGRYITVLKESTKVSPKVIGKLEDFKDYYRNVITHPDEFWDIDNADGAFGTAINVIDAVVQDIERIKNIS